MKNNLQRWLNQFLILFEEQPSFKCARRIWLICHDTNRPVPDHVMKVFIEGLEKDDKKWNPDPPTGPDRVFERLFIQNHREEQSSEGKKPSTAAAIRAYIAYRKSKNIHEEYGAIEKRLPKELRALKNLQK